MKHLQIYGKGAVKAHTAMRRFETHVGEYIGVLPNLDDVNLAIQQSKARYVVIGIKENAGNRANLLAGSGSYVWDSFLDEFLNTQSNDFFSGENVLVLGHFDFTAITALIEQTAKSTEEKIIAYRHAVNVIDAEVEQLIHIITQNRKLPIVVGGGASNAYPCIKGAAKGWTKSSVIPIAEINVIQLSAHTNYGSMEGRHSGNALRYAEEDGYLDKFCLLGVHENKLPQNVWIDLVNNPFGDCITYEDIFLLEKRTFEQAVNVATGFTEDTLTGIELNLDSIDWDGTGIGINMLTARQFINYAVMDSQPAYLHIAELCELATHKAAKALGYLVCDFIKAMESSYISEG